MVRTPECPRFRNDVDAVQRTFARLIYHIIRRTDVAALKDLENALMYVLRRIAERRAAARSVVEKTELDHLTPASFARSSRRDRPPRQGGALTWERKS